MPDLPDGVPDDDEAFENYMNEATGDHPPTIEEISEIYDHTEIELGEGNESSEEFDLDGSDISSGLSGDGVDSYEGITQPSYADDLDVVEEDKDQSNDESPSPSSCTKHHEFIPPAGSTYIYIPIF